MKPGAVGGDAGVGLYAASVSPGWDVDAWRAALGAVLRAELPPSAVCWSEDGRDLFAAPPVESAPPLRVDVRLPKLFVERAASALCNAHPSRLPLLHRIAWRMVHGERHLLDDPADPDSVQLATLESEVRRDSHKMKAFVRFAERAPGTDDFVAWFEPSHRIVDRVAPFFKARFAGMRWALFTPYRSATWDGAQLSFGPGATRAELPPTDDADGDALWRTYYTHIFNPARLNPAAMQREMPKKYWANLPEAQLIPTLVAQAPARAKAMQDAAPTMPHRSAAARGRQAGLARPAAHATAPTGPASPASASLEQLREAAAGCRNCELWQAATHTVFGEGPASAALMLIGEAPGDREDLSGRPFVGPAGRLLDAALKEAGLDRESLYVTSAVKHFHYERSGKVRLHRKPKPGHIAACRPWLAGELEAVAPRVVVCLGGTAAQALLGRPVSTLTARGQVQTLPNGARVVPTVHPAWVLRQGSGNPQDEGFAMLVADLRLARSLLGTPLD